MPILQIPVSLYLIPVSKRYYSLHPHPPKHKFPMRGLNLIQSLSSELTHTLSDWHAISSIYSEFEIKKDEFRNKNSK